MSAALLGLYGLVWALAYTLRAINLRHLRRHGHEVPAGFEQVLDRERLQRSADYTFAHSRLGLIENALHSAVLLLFLFAGPLGWYDAWIGQQGWHWLVAGLLFFAGLSLADGALGMPFELWRHFRIERRFGFNRRSFGLWLADSAKSTAIAALLGAVLVSGGLGLVRGLPELWWLAVWAFLAALSVLLIYLAPVLIEPLFHTFTPVDRPELVEAIGELSRRAGVRVERILQLDASRRSGHSNAYFTGLGRVKRVVLYDTLLAQLSPDEILAVLAHELGHWKRHHIARRLLISLGGLGAACLAAWWLSRWPELPALVGLDQASFPARLVILSLLGSLVGALLAPLGAMLSRRHEREADRFAAELTGQPEHLASALVGMAAENLSNLHPHPLYARLYYSHPPVVERVAALRASGSASV